MTPQQSLKALERIYKTQKALLKHIDSATPGAQEVSHLDDPQFFNHLSFDQIEALHTELHKNPETGLYGSYFSAFIECCLYYEGPSSYLKIPLGLHLLKDARIDNYFIAVVEKSLEHTPIIEHYLTNYFKLPVDNLSAQEKSALFKKVVLKNAVFSQNFNYFIGATQWSETEKAEAFLEKHNEVPVESPDPMVLPQRYQYFNRLYRTFKEQKSKDALLPVILNLIPIESALSPLMEPPHYWAKLAIFSFPAFLPFMVKKNPNFLEQLKNQTFEHQIGLHTRLNEDETDTESYQLNGIQYYFLSMSRQAASTNNKDWKKAQPYFEAYIQDIFKDVVHTVHYHDKTVSFMDVLLKEKYTDLFFALSPELLTPEQKQMFGGILVKKFLQTNTLADSESARNLIIELRQQLQMLPPTVLESIVQRADFQKERAKLEEHPDFDVIYQPHFDFLQALLEKNKLSTTISILALNTNEKLGQAAIDKKTFEASKFKI